MSKAEVERFHEDLASNPVLQGEAKAAATGLASVVAFAKKHGYEFTLDDAKSYIQARAPRELDDQQLDALAGGAKDVAAAQTNVVVNAEVAANAAVATDVAVGAEVAVAAVVVLI